MFIREGAFNRAFMVYHELYIGGILQPKAVGVQWLAVGHKVAATELEATTNGSVGMCSTI